MPAGRDDIASELVAFARFLGGVPSLVRRRMTVAEALAIVRQRLQTREANFLTVVGRIQTNEDGSSEMNRLGALRHEWTVFGGMGAGSAYKGFMQRCLEESGFAAGTKKTT